MPQEFSCTSVHVMDRPWEAFGRARRVIRGCDDLAGWESADLPSVIPTGRGDVASSDVYAHSGVCVCVSLERVVVNVICLASTQGSA